ncbi:alpha-hydroxy-acid oxidizing protein [Nocardioides sp.]|uniref:alpha-hydroxy-acid oxidizing protein n=1 Tax=Nocardioides sp. TaxID=35761 RepID=UPI003783700F
MEPESFGGYQTQLYLDGLSGHRPSLPCGFAELEERALASMSESVREYVCAPAGDGWTQEANVAAFRTYGLMPRMLADAGERDLSVELFGRTITAPAFFAPVGVAGICAQDGHGDLAVARAGAALGLPVVATTLSNDPLEEVIRHVGGAPAWFQLYVPSDWSVCESLVRRAEAVGYEALVVTLDAWVGGWRPRDVTASNLPQLRGHCLSNYFTDPVFRARLARPPEEDPQAATLEWAAVFGRPLAWSDLDRLREMTSLPLVVKGICHPEDARRARDAGVEAIYCSNHGGRQANGGLPAIDCLPEVVAAVDVPVLFDSGVRSGAELVKALALGAAAVGIGRPWVYGMALGGTDGAVHVMRSILAESDLLMAVDGYPTLRDLAPSAIRRVPTPGTS